MTQLAYRLPSPGLPTALISIVGLGVALLVGALLAVDVSYGVALLLAAAYAAIALVNLPLGIALWIPLVFLEGIPAFNLAGKAAGVLILFAWLVSLGARRDAVAAALNRHRRVLLVAVALLVWLTLSLAWADDLGLAAADIWHWYALFGVLVVVITTMDTEADLRMVLYALVGGAVLSIAIGVADHSFTVEDDGGARFQGGAGDPNYLAASLVACTVVAAGLLAVERQPSRRLLLVAAIAALVAGIISSGSRGGLLAAAVAGLLAFAIFKRGRIYVAAAGAAVAGIAAIAFMNVPGAWARITDFDDDNGRSSLWTVGARMWEQQPVAGVGLNNFVIHSAEYVQQPGALEDLKLVVERPHVPHNTYLQMLAETGVVGLALFLGLCAGCLGSTWTAIKRFDAERRAALATAARSVLVATVSVLAAAMFLSAATDKRLWLLFALGPVLLAVAERVSDPEAASQAAGG